MNSRAVKWCLIIIAACELATAGIKVYGWVREKPEPQNTAIIEKERLYRDSLRISDQRVKKLTEQLDSVKAYKRSLDQAIKKNKTESNEKQNRILSAGDSLLRWISDSTLRENLYRHDQQGQR